MLRLLQERSPRPAAAIFDGRTLQSSPERGARAGYDGYKHKKGSKVHVALDTRGHLFQVRSCQTGGRQAQLRAAATPRGRRAFLRWLARFPRLSRDYERLPRTLAGLPWLAFACLWLSNLFKTLTSSA